jgi:hypothetical protein
MTREAGALRRMLKAASFQPALRPTEPPACPREGLCWVFLQEPLRLRQNPAKTANQLLAFF